jgi:NAD(P)-dependent dehydrogenase (short-subunit alcohol dehydrogenase family)
VRLKSEEKALEGRAALVTGGARRIGRAIALALAEAGAGVTITYCNSGQDAAVTVRDLEALGCHAQAVRCDVRSEDSVREAVSSSAAFHGRLDLVVNNAAVFHSAPLAELSLADWDAVSETNTRGPFLVSREALPHLCASHGRIVNIGSLGGIEPWATHAHYCASKAGLHMLTQAMAKAFAPEISVNCVAPGWIEMESAGPEAARFAARTPMARNGKAADVAEAVLYFAQNSGFVTGQVLVVDGGLGL